MSAILSLYDYVKGKVLALPEIHHFDFWNEQIGALASDTTKFKSPAVFFDYSVSWDNSRNGSQENGTDYSPEQYGVASFSLHVVIRKTKPGVDINERDHLSLVDKVYRSIHFNQIPMVTRSAIQRSGDENDSNSEGMRDHVISFEVDIIECGISVEDEGMYPNGDELIEYGPPLLLDIKHEFLII